MASEKKEDLISGEERRPNQWNVFQGEHPGLKKQDCRDLYKKEKEKNPSEPERRKAHKSRIRCSLDKFRIVLSKLNDHQKEVISKTPFASLLDLEKGGLSQQRDLIKSIVSHFNCDKMTLTVYKGGETQDFPITAEDFSNIMGIQNGKDASLVEENVELDADLLNKFCILEKNNKYKNIDINKVENELKNAVEDNAIKQTFALIALHYIVCPAPAGKLGKKFLWYVKNVNSLHDQPWVSVAMSALKHGIQTYNKGKGVEKNLGGCVLFLQLYCMKRRGFMEGLNVSKISEEVTEKFHKNWMIDHAPERKRKKYLADKICKDLEDLSDLIKVQPEKVGLQLLLELHAFNENCKNTITASTSGLIGSDQAKEFSNRDLLTRNAKAASTSGASRSDFYPSSDIEKLEPGNWLNDNLMNFYLRYLEQNVSPTNGAISDYHFLNTFFYSKLKDVLSPKGIAENQFDSFRRWWDKENIFQKEYIVIPIHEYSHWSVVIVCKRNKTDKSEPILLHLDSYSTHDATQNFENIKRFMEEEVNRGSIKSIVHGVNDTVKGVNIEVPQQQNTSDCGVYVLLFSEHFIKQAPNRMETEYTRMFGKKWFEEKEVGGLRRRMKSLLLREKVSVYKRRVDKKKQKDSATIKADENLEKDYATRNSKASVGKSLDIMSDDQPPSRWFEGKHSPMTVHGTDGSVGQPSQVGERWLDNADNWPFVRTTPLWQTIESLEAFHKIPQKPHFRPLLEGVKPAAREGLAFGTMVTFSTVVDKTCGLRFEDPRSTIEDCLETLAELESYGFDVEVIRERLTGLLLVKDKQEELDERCKGVEVKIEEHMVQGNSEVEEIEEIDIQIRELEERRGQLLLEKENRNSEINDMKAAWEGIEEEMRKIGA